MVIDLHLQPDSGLSFCHRFLYEAGLSEWHNALVRPRLDVESRPARGPSLVIVRNLHPYDSSADAP